MRNTMVRFARTHIAAVAALVWLTACQTASAQQPIPGAVAPRDAAARRADAWRHEITVVNPGTRSEGIRESLFWGVREIPHVFQRVLAFGLLYEYRPMHQIWDRSGYLCTGKRDAPVDGAFMTADEIGKGWVAIAFPNRRPGMPTSWLSVVRDGHEYAVDPAKVDALIASLGLKPLGGE